MVFIRWPYFQLKLTIIGTVLIETGSKMDELPLPQEGIDNGEELKQAALRELLEEIGTGKAKIVAKNKGWIYYNLPEKFIPICWDGRYSSPKQRWMI
uniref:Nudix hydrolase domain-containing protein n=1 Tax=Onchocerca volvulus TaxID=6282 RepID=A0A8R1Y1B0_ONCVO